MAAFCPQSSTETLGDFLTKDIFPNNRLLCSSCGYTAFFTNPGPLQRCCIDGKGIDDFASLQLHDDGTVDTTFSNSKITLSPETKEEIELVSSLRSYLKTCNEFSTPEERLEMLNALRTVHYKSFLKAFKDENPESTMTVQEFREMVEKR
jgi:hypothetical protein